MLRGAGLRPPSEGRGLLSDPEQRVVGDRHPEPDHQRLLDPAHRQLA
jgi:hypothetical protein